MFEFPEEIKLTTTLADVIDFGAKPDEAYYYREGKQNFYPDLKANVTSQDTVYQWRRQYVRENKRGVVPTLTANMGTGGHNVPLILTDSGEIRKLTPKETSMYKDIQRLLSCLRVFPMVNSINRLEIVWSSL